MDYESEVSDSSDAEVDVRGDAHNCGVLSDAAGEVPRPGGSSVTDPRPGGSSMTNPRPGGSSMNNPRPGTSTSRSPRPGTSTSR